MKKCSTFSLFFYCGLMYMFITHIAFGMEGEQPKKFNLKGSLRGYVSAVVAEADQKKLESKETASQQLSNQDLCRLMCEIYKPKEEQDWYQFAFYPSGQSQQTLVEEQSNEGFVIIESKDSQDDTSELESHEFSDDFTYKEPEDEIAGKVKQEKKSGSGETKQDDGWRCVIS